MYRWVKITSGFFVFLMLTFSVALAEQTVSRTDGKQVEKTQIKENSVERSIIHFSGSNAANPLAVAINLLLEEAFLQNSKAEKTGMVGRMEFVSSAKSAKVLRKNEQVYLKDLPYLFLKTEAKQAVIAWLDMDGDDLNFVIRSFNGVNVANINAVHLKGKVHTPAYFVKHVFDKMKTEIIKNLEFKTPDLNPDISFEAFKMLGKGYRLLDSKKKQQALLDILTAREMGIDIHSVIAKWLDVDKPNLKAHENALALDAALKTEQALKAYEKIKVKKRNFKVKLQHVKLLQKLNQNQKAIQLLEKLKKFARKDADYWFTSGTILAATGKSQAAYDAYLKAHKLGGDSTGLYQALLKNATKLEDKQSQIKFLGELADKYKKIKRYDLANAKLLEVLKLGAKPELLDKLRIDLLSGSQKATLKTILKSYKDKPVRSSLLANAILATQTNKISDAEALYNNKLLANSSGFYTRFMAGKFFLDHSQQIDKGITHLERAKRADGKNPEMLEALSAMYLKAELCDDALNTISKRLALSPGDSFVQLKRADIYSKCNKKDAAINELKLILKRNPDYVLAVGRMVEVYRKFGDKANAKANMELLKKFDIKLFKKLTPKKPKPVKKEVKKPKIKEKKKEIKKPKPLVPVTFSATRELMKALPAGLKSVALLNLDDLHTSFVASVFNKLTSTTYIDYDKLEEDFENIINVDGEVVIDDEMRMRVKIYDSGSPLRSDSFADVMSPYLLDAVVLFSARKVDSNKVSVDLYSYIKGSNEVLHTSATVTGNVSQLLKFNPLIFTPVVLVLLLLFALYLKKRKTGVGRLVIKISHPNTSENAFFAAKLSLIELEKPFDIDELMQTKWNTDRKLAGKQITKFFSSRNPLIAIADPDSNNKDRIDLPGVVPGHYHVYVVTVLVNMDNNVPVGSHDVHRRAVIKKNGISELPITFSFSDASIDIRITREVKVSKKIHEKVNGVMKEVEREISHWEEVGGASVEINNDPAFSKTSIEGQAVSYNLPRGIYQIMATYQDLACLYTLDVTDFSSKTIEMRLTDQNVGKLPSNNKTAKPTDASDPNLDIVSKPRAKAKYGVEDSKTVDLESIELADDILSGTSPISENDLSSAAMSTVTGATENTQIPVDLDDLFKASSQMPQNGEMIGIGQNEISDKERKDFLKSAEVMKKTERYNEAAELFLRAGNYDAASEMAQRSGNQNLNYKIYGVSYLKARQYSEAVEMFKYADEPLLEADAYEGLRLFDEANRKRGEYWEAFGDLTRATESYEKASAWDKIGELHERMQSWQQAGEAFYRAGIYERAAMCFEQSADIKHAAESYEMDAQYEKAAKLYGQLGSNVKVFNLLEKSGKYCEAAEGYKKFGLVDEAIHACQQVAQSSGDYLKAALIMGKIFIDKEEIQLARNIYYKVVENAEIEQDNIEKYYEFGVLIQEQGMVIEAKALFELLQTVKYNYADITIRIQNLQEQIENDHMEYGTAPPPGTVPPFPGYRTNAQSMANQQITPQPNRETPVSSRYSFEKEVGRGAMGIVYMARDTALDRIVAYKTVANAIKENPASLKYFLSEAKSLAALNHMNVVTVFDVGQENNNFFITMEFVDGRSLGDFIREKGRLSTKNIVVIATKICAGLEYARTKNVVHRDIKPSNIMISNQGEVKIMDFGLAKILNEAVQDKTMVRGTPLYMSPEQVEGVGVDHVSDLYSFGVTLFEMATGTLPFTKGDIAYHHLHTPPPSPIRYNPSLPEVLEKIILKCLTKTKADRYQSAAEIKADLAPLRQALMNK